MSGPCSSTLRHSTEKSLCVTLNSTCLPAATTPFDNFSSAGASSALAALGEVTNSPVHHIFVPYQNILALFTSTLPSPPVVKWSSLMSRAPNSHNPLFSNSNPLHSYPWTSATLAKVEIILSSLKRLRIMPAHYRDGVPILWWGLEYEKQHSCILFVALDQSSFPVHQRFAIIKKTWC